MQNKLRRTVAAIVLASTALGTQARPSGDEPWQTLAPVGDGPTARHEAAAVVAGDRLYLLGGRGNRPIEAFDPQSRTWRDLGMPPVSIHHFQPVVIGERIYVVGALTGTGYPEEASLEEIWVFDTGTETWSQAGSIPTARVRGSAAAVVYDDRIYLVGGNINGHSGPSVAWLDRFDPATGDWDVLLPAPHARDHAYAAVVGDRLYFAGGRRTDVAGGPFDNTESNTDVYDFATGEWSTAAPLPTARAGAPVVAYGRELIVIGGESPATKDAHDTVEALDVDRDVWRTLQPMRQGRHGGGAVVIGDTLHAIAGNLKRGGGAETDSHETLDLAGGDDPDRDRDGLDNDREIDLGTDPDDADTDDDGLEDGDEIDRGTDPQRADSDRDDLSDGEEVEVHLTDPLRADTDDDGFEDGVEVAAGTDPHDGNDPGQASPRKSGGGGSGGLAALMAVAMLVVRRRNRAARPWC